MKVRWFKDGKFFNGKDLSDRKIEIGDEIVFGENTYYYSYGHSVYPHSISFDDNHWEVQRAQGKTGIVSDIKYINTDHYIGEILLLKSPYWPWFQKTNIELV